MYVWPFGHSTVQCSAVCVSLFSSGRERQAEACIEEDRRVYKRM
jgi:hypothetical protein